MNPLSETAAQSSHQRKPGQRPTARQREELLVLVERALVRGARTPTEVLAAVPALGTWDTARAYVALVRAGWRRSEGEGSLRESRAELVAAVVQTRERALAGLASVEKPAEIARLAREVERLVRCEAWLRGLEPDARPVTDDDERDTPDLRDWIPDEIEYLTEEMEKAKEGAYKLTLADLIDTLRDELRTATRSATPRHVESPSSSRTNTTNLPARERAVRDGPAADAG